MHSIIYIILILSFVYFVLIEPFDDLLFETREPAVAAQKYSYNINGPRTDLQQDYAALTDLPISLRPRFFVRTNNNDWMTLQSPHDGCIGRGVPGYDSLFDRPEYMADDKHISYENDLLRDD